MHPPRVAGPAAALPTTSIGDTAVGAQSGVVGRDHRPAHPDEPQHLVAVIEVTHKGGAQSRPMPLVPWASTTTGQRPAGGWPGGTSSTPVAAMSRPEEVRELIHDPRRRHRNSLHLVGGDGFPADQLAKRAPWQRVRRVVKTGARQGVGALLLPRQLALWTALDRSGLGRCRSERRR